METTNDGDRYREVVQSVQGYGFIQPQGGGKDIFVHISAVERAGLSTLNEGQQVQYPGRRQTDRKARAEALRVFVSDQRIALRK